MKIPSFRCLAGSRLLCPPWPMKNPPPPRPRMTSPASTPERLADGPVTFRFRGKGEKVTAAGQFGPAVSLEKSGDNRWAGTTADPVKPGVYEYHLTVDGLNVIDALNPAIKPQRWRPGSGASCPCSGQSGPVGPAGHPHGTVHQHTYKSGRWKMADLVVYTPPGYENAGTAITPLPVLYLAHGLSDNRGTWTVHAQGALDSRRADGPESGAADQSCSCPMPTLCRPARGGRTTTARPTPTPSAPSW